MQNLNKNQWIAVSVGLALLAYLLFTAPIMNFFNSATGTGDTAGSDVQANAQVPQTGVMVKDDVVGEGPMVEPGDVLTAHYVGSLEDGKVFDSSLDRGVPITFTVGVGQVIRGWDEGLMGMRVGGKRLLKITPEYGYGAEQAGAIPPNSTLIFAVELLNDQKPASR